VPIYGRVARLLATRNNGAVRLSRWRQSGGLCGGGEQWVRRVLDHCCGCEGWYLEKMCITARGRPEATTVALKSEGGLRKRRGRDTVEISRYGREPRRRIVRDDDGKGGKATATRERCWNGFSGGFLWGRERVGTSPTDARACPSQTEVPRISASSHHVRCSCARAGVPRQFCGYGRPEFSTSWRRYWIHIWIHIPVGAMPSMKSPGQTCIKRGTPQIADHMPRTCRRAKPRASRIHHQTN
jgi:hypothetical protein